MNNLLKLAMVSCFFEYICVFFDIWPLVMGFATLSLVAMGVIGVIWMRDN